MSKRHIAILGSTGSIGTQALNVIAQHKDLFEVELLTANNNVDLLIEQAIEHRPNNVVICNHEHYDKINKALIPYDIKVFAGKESVNELVKSNDINIVLAAMVGFSGLEPTINAIKTGKAIALANKETLVAAGEIVTSLARQYNAPLLPVDSEHSAIFQCLQGEHTCIEKLILTASGGPFRDSSLEQIQNATLAQALNHPNWSMGAKITIDSATMMNKGLEMIEASWLFNVPAEKIEIVIHPQSIIHSMVEFPDGSIKAQLGAPDMRVPIQYALSYPTRLDLNSPRLNFWEIDKLTFKKPDLEKFPLISIAYQVHKKGGNMPCIMNAANEIAVDAFLNNRIRFRDIPTIIEKTLESSKFIKHPKLEEIFATHSESENIARILIQKL